MYEDREINELKISLKDLGISIEFIEQKDIRNVYMAKEIVEGYDFGRELKPEEKRALIQSILSNSCLNKGRNRYLTILMKSLQQIGLGEQEIYGTIINLGVNGKVIEEKGYNYSYLLINQNNVCQTISRYKNQIETKVSSMAILTALSENLNQEEEQALIKELEEILGIDREFIGQKDMRNVYMAKAIIGGYDFGRELKPEEKRALMQSILSSSALNKEKGIYLSKLMQKLQKIGLEEQEIYGAIINLGVNEKVLKETGYGYIDLLANKNNASETIEKYKDSIETRVSSITILTALSNNFNKQEIMKELEETLGIDKEYIEQKNIRKVYIAKKIVEGYDFGRELKPEEKRVLIQSILNNSLFDTERILLITLVQKLQKIGLEEQEIYGTIINLGVNEKVVEEAGYSYTNLLNNQKNACKTISRYKEQIETKVSSMTILTALGKHLNQEEEQALIKELEGILGIDREFIEQKDIRNVYMAKATVEGYDFGRELNPEEKRGLIQSILENTLLNKEKSIFLTKLMQNLQKIGLEEQEIYGTIINLGVNGKVIEKKEYVYSYLLNNFNNASQTLGRYKDEIQTEVAEETIQKAIKKSEKIMRKAVKKQKEKGKIGEQSETRAELESLVRGELAQENVVDQEQQE